MDSYEIVCGIPATAALGNASRSTSCEITFYIKIFTATNRAMAINVYTDLKSHQSLYILQRRIKIKLLN